MQLHAEAFREVWRPMPIAPCLCRSGRHPQTYNMLATQPGAARLQYEPRPTHHDIGAMTKLGHAKAAGQLERVQPGKVLLVLLRSAQLGNGATAKREVHARFDRQRVVCNLGASEQQRQHGHWRDTGKLSPADLTPFDDACQCLRLAPMLHEPLNVHDGHARTQMHEPAKLSTSRPAWNLSGSRR